jgi:hypothetical protein
LKEAELPVSLQSLGNYAFYYDFSLENIIVDEASDYFKSKERIQIILKWEGYVRKVVDNKGKPPMLY